MENQTSNPKRRIAILGGGFGGLYTALSLYWRGGCLSADITLIDRESRFLFTPLLYELLTDEVTEWQIAPNFRDLLPTPVNVLRAEAESVDVEAGEIRFTGGKSFTYDILVVALGSGNAHFGVPGAKQYSIPFRTIPDAKELERRLKTLPANRPVTVIGAGPSGVELSAKIADFLGEAGKSPQNHVRLMDRNPEILPGYAAELRAQATDRLKELNVDLRLGSAIASITPEGIETESGEKLPSELNVWVAGSAPSPVLPTLGCLLDRRGRIPVGRSLQVPGHPSIFVLGDNANAGDGVPATAQVAVRQAEVVAANVLSLMNGCRMHEYRHVPLGEMLSLGRGVAAANLFGVKFDGSTGNFLRKLIYLFTLPSPAHAFRVGVHWTENAMDELTRSFTK